MDLDEEQEIPEFDIESRNWKKLQENMQLIGFREGAVKGKDLSVQEGFNLGYSDGFKLGEQIGEIKGIISCQSELGVRKNERVDLDEKTLNNISIENCVICSGEQNSTKLQQNFEDFIKSQQHQINESIKIYKNSNSNLFIENG